MICFGDSQVCVLFSFSIKLKMYIFYFFLSLGISWFGLDGKERSDSHCYWVIMALLWGLELCALGSGELRSQICPVCLFCYPLRPSYLGGQGQSLGMACMVIHTRKSKVGTSSHLGGDHLRCWNLKRAFQKRCHSFPTAPSLFSCLLDSLASWWCSRCAKCWWLSRILHPGDESWAWVRDGRWQ